MAYRLKSKQMQVPNGFRFIQPETGWSAPRFASFDVIVKNLIGHRQGRPDLVAKHGWSTDYDGVAYDVEQFNVRLCLQHGWGEYLDGMDAGGGLPPKSKPPTLAEQEQVSVAGHKAAKIWSGVKTLNDWIDSGEPPVVQEVASSRAFVCSTCPQNGQGGFEKWFTKPAAGAIQKQIERLADRKLSTPYDDQINICQVCLCPLKLKVHTPTKFIKAHMSEAVLTDLLKVEKCWIVVEVSAK